MLQGKIKVKYSIIESGCCQTLLCKCLGPLHITDIPTIAFQLSLLTFSPLQFRLIVVAKPIIPKVLIMLTKESILTSALIRLLQYVIVSLILPRHEPSLPRRSSITLPQLLYVLAQLKRFWPILLPRHEPFRPRRSSNFLLLP